MILPIFTMAQASMSTEIQEVLTVWAPRLLSIRKLSPGKLRLLFMTRQRKVNMTGTLMTLLRWWTML